MKIETFELERFQSLWENTVKYNLTDSGVHPFNLRELLNADEIEELLSLSLGYGQTNGSILLRDAISRLYPGSDRDNILVTNGTAEANFIAMWSQLEPGDEIIYMLPNYMQIWGIARALGVNVRTFQLRQERGWDVDIDELKRLATPRTKMIVVCHPNNPTGSVLSADTMHEIADVAADVGAWIYADEIYRGSELDGRECPSFWSLCDRVIVAAGLSKAYALPGLRIGWLVGPKALAATAWAYHDYTSIATNIVSNQVAALALQPEMRSRILERNRKILNENLNVLSRWLERHPEIFSLIPPRAGGMAFVQYTLPINSTELANRLRDEKSVLIVPGDFFGMDKFVRLGIGAEKQHLLSGLELMEEVLHEIQGRT